MRENRDGTIPVLMTTYRQGNGRRGLRLFYQGLQQ